jgi:transposase InsO family protein
MLSMALCSLSASLCHDRDNKFCASVRAMLRSSGVQCLMLPSRSPNLNAFAERWVRTIKIECLLKLILFGEASLRRTLNDFSDPGSSSPNCIAESASRLSGLL